MLLQISRQRRTRLLPPRTASATYASTEHVTQDILSFSTARTHCSTMSFEASATTIHDEPSIPTYDATATHDAATANDPAAAEDDAISTYDADTCQYKLSSNTKNKQPWV